MFCKERERERTYYALPNQPHKQKTYQTFPCCLMVAVGSAKLLAIDKLESLDATQTIHLKPANVCLAHRSIVTVFWTLIKVKCSLRKPSLVKEEGDKTGNNCFHVEVAPHCTHYTLVVGRLLGEHCAQRSHPRTRTDSGVGSARHLRTSHKENRTPSPCV